MNERENKGVNMDITGLKPWHEHMYIEGRKNKSTNDGRNANKPITRYITKA